MIKTAPAELQVRKIDLRADDAMDEDGGAESPPMVLTATTTTTTATTTTATTTKVVGVAGFLFLSTSFIYSIICIVL